MRKRKLGADGPLVSALGFGCMSLAGAFGPTTEAESFEALDAALEAGIDFLDTANIYGMGVSETVIGKWLADRRPQLTLATKVGIDNSTTPRSFRNDEAYIRAELEGSLRRLGREHVELYYIHRRDTRVPVEELVGTLSRLIEEGKIGGYGLSEIAPATLRRAHAVHPCMAVQNEYSLWTRQPELGLVQACAELGVAFVAFSPVARGMLGDVPLSREAAQDFFRSQNPRFIEPNFSANTRIIDGFRALARARGVTTSALALAWLLARGEHVIPIPATRTAAHLREWLGAVEMDLTAADIAEIETVLPVGFAHGDRYSDTQIAGVERYC